MRRWLGGVLAVVLVMAVPGGAESRGWDRLSFLIPDVARVQYAGHAGFLSAGAGYAWWGDKVEASLNYGYVPGFVGGGSAHIFSERNAFSPGSLALPQGLSLEPIVIGVTANVTIGQRYRFYFYRGESGYYWPDALYFWLFAGPKIAYRVPRIYPFKSIGIQVETGTISPYLEAYLANRSIGLSDVMSLAISSQANF